MRSQDNTSLSPGYDADGNLTGDGTDTYTLGARNHLSAISGGATASFIYEKTIGGATTQFLYDGLNPVQELNGANPPTPTAKLTRGSTLTIISRGRIRAARGLRLPSIADCGLPSPYSSGAPPNTGYAAAINPHWP
ncbi:MAG: hypothetical protein ACREQN_05175 [Candidatus Binataceae bacterium]